VRGGALLFPGQGSQFAGMGRDLAVRFPEARAVYERADAALARLGLSVSKVSFEGTEDVLKQTAVTQPAILTHSIAVWEVLRARGLTPGVAAGHSLGEYSALVAAGALSLEDAVVLVRRRGLFMQEAVPPGQGAMSAVLGLSPGEVAAARLGGRWCGARWAREHAAKALAVNMADAKLHHRQRRLRRGGVFRQELAARMGIREPCRDADKIR
jgi:acyl transferase domain-containing protein